MAGLPGIRIEFVKSFVDGVELGKIIDATASGHLTFFMPEFGKAFSVAGVGNWFRDQCDMANPRHCTFHGLRKTASVRLAEAGCTPHEIAMITGRASLKAFTASLRTPIANGSPGLHWTRSKIEHRVAN